MSTPESYLQLSFDESLAAQKRFLEENASRLIAASRAIAQCVLSGGKLLIFGNGGSAADAQHMAAEMVGRMLMDRRPLAAIALTTDTSNITALANDYSYDIIFERQIQALARPGDLVVAISTSGKSKNVILGVEAAKKIGCKIITLTGGEGGPLKSLGDFSLNVAGGLNSSRIQESHIFAIHSLVDMMDRFFLSDGNS